MAQLDEIRSIIMNMKAQSRAQAQAEAPQTEGSAALAIEQAAVKVAEPMQLIRGGKFENYLNAKMPKPKKYNVSNEEDDLSDLF